MTQATEVTIQVDVHGPASAENAQAITTLLRDGYAVDAFLALGADVQTLHADDPKQIPFWNSENQMENQNPENKLNIELSEEIAEGIYSNLAIITHSPTEFVVDFIKVMPGVPKAKVKSRIVLTPQHAKRLMKALADNVQRFEQIHGKIKDSEMNALPLNFGGPTAQA